MLRLGSFIVPTRDERLGYGPEARSLDTALNVWADAVLAESGYRGRCATGTPYDDYCRGAARIEALRRIARVTQRPDPNGPTPLYGDWQTTVALARELVPRFGVQELQFDPTPYAPGGPFALQTARVSIFPDVNANAPEEWARTFTVPADDQGRAQVPATMRDTFRQIGECDAALQRAREAMRPGPLGPDASAEEAAVSQYLACVAPYFAELPPSGAFVTTETERARDEWRRREPVEQPPQPPPIDTIEGRESPPQPPPDWAYPRESPPQPPPDWAYPRESPPQPPRPSAAQPSEPASKPARTSRGWLWVLGLIGAGVVLAKVAR